MTDALKNDFDLTLTTRSNENLKSGMVGSDKPEVVYAGNFGTGQG